MRVLSIDPGYDRVGVAVLEHTTTGEELLYSDCIITDKKDSLPDRILVVGKAVRDLIKKFTPDAIALETIFFNKNIKTAIGVAQARGAIVYIGRANNCKIYEFGPQEIKVAITGYGKSDKQAVFEMVKRLVSGAPEKALDDEYDAIAVGVTCLAHYRRNSTLTT